MTQAKEKSAGSTSNQDAQNYRGDATSTSGKLDFKREDAVSCGAAQSTTGIDNEEQAPIKGNNDEKDGDIKVEVQQPRRRRQNIMNDEQLATIEKAVLDEPEMQQNLTPLSLRAEELSKKGPKITSVELVAWLSHQKNRQKALSAQKQKPIKGNDEEQPRKGGSHIMNDAQIETLQKALVDEPNMQRSPASLLFWATALSGQGPKITPKQLRDRIYNQAYTKRKHAAREAAREDYKLGEPEMQQSRTSLSLRAEELSKKVCHVDRINLSLKFLRIIMPPILFQGPKNTSVELDAWLSHQKNRQKALSAPKQIPIKGNDEKQPRKGRSHIMNDKQIETLQKALVDEPNMHRSPASLQIWATTLSDQGPKITPKQLRDRIRNQAHIKRKHAAQEAAREDYKLDPGQLVRVVDKQGKDVGSGKVFQVEGRWHQFDNLEDARVCVVELTECKYWTCPLPYPSQGTGWTLLEARFCNGGYTRVAWDISMVHKV